MANWQLPSETFHLAQKALLNQATEALADALEKLSYDERRLFAQWVKSNNLAAPQVVFFNYATQEWIL